MIEFTVIMLVCLAQGVTLRCKEWNALQKVQKLPHLNFPSVYTYNRLGFTTSQVQSIPIHCHPSPTVGFNVQQRRGEGWFISLSTSSSSSPRSSSSGSLAATEGTAGNCSLLTLMALGVLEHIYGTGSFITRMTFYGDRHQMTPVELRSGQCSLQLSA